MDGNAEDLSWYQNNGILEGTEPAHDRQGIPGAALLFDGVDDRMLIPTSESLRIGYYTLSLWINTTMQVRNIL